MAFYVKLLTVLAALRANIPKAIEFLNFLLTLIPPTVGPGGGGLELVDAPPKVLRLEAEISKRLSTKGRQKAFDFSRIRALAKWISESGNGAALLAILRKLFGG